MSDDDSNDVVMVENPDNVSDGVSADTDTETRPLMKLFQRLISNDNKQNTILTNAQIVSILLKEFDIDIETLHELELDIYLNVVKRFLKDWPKWDEFDHGINMLRKRTNAHKHIQKTLETKYVDLKEYLRVQLEATKPLAQKAVTQMIKENAKRMAKVDTSDVVLEVHCSRKQLNELILSHPVSDEGIENNIFNLTDMLPTTISVNQVPIESILNWWKVQVTLDCKYLSITRQTIHRLNHVLVNAKNGPRELNKELNTNMQTKEVKKFATFVDKQKLLAILALLQYHVNNNLVRPVLQAFVDILLRDLAPLKELTVPGLYRQFANKYPYYRKLRKQSKISTPVLTNYDLYLEETLAPMYMLNINKVHGGNVDWDKIENQHWLAIECVECKMKFTENLIDAVKEHFDTYHANEPDWTCTNCERSFNMNELTKNHWHHDCYPRLFHPN